MMSPVGGGEAARQRVALAAAVLEHDADVGADRARDRDRVVDRVAVDEHDLVDRSAGSRVSTCGRFAASLSVGITTLIVGACGRRRPVHVVVAGATSFVGSTATQVSDNAAPRLVLAA